ncbi:MAG: GNAT family N-acetyltransferase [Caldilineaceae bacterium]|nr:GNAT family N-acetyltransferase [Caldilineaceae bacterium]
MIEIRRAQITDEGSLATIRREAILALAVPTLSWEAATAWADQVSADRFARALQEHLVWVAVEAGVVGWVEVVGDRIAALYVAPCAAGQGVGSALLTFAESAIEQAGYSAVHLEASPNALAFYLRRGYTQVGPSDAEGAYPLCKGHFRVGDIPGTL